MERIASWIGLAGSSLQLIGTILTLWGVLSATSTPFQKLRALAGALWAARTSALAAKLSDLNEEDKLRILQGLAILATGYLLALISQILLIFATQ